MEISNKLHVDRLLATQSIVLSLKGIPALYFSLFVGGKVSFFWRKNWLIQGENDIDEVNRLFAEAKSGRIDPDRVHTTLQV